MEEPYLQAFRPNSLLCYYSWYCFLTSVFQLQGPFFSHRTHTAERGNNSSSGGDFLVGFWREMPGVADSAKMFPFSLAVCQILLLSKPGECHQHAISSDLSSFTHSNSALCLFFFFFPSSFRVSQPLTFNCWVSAKRLCIWHQILQSPRKMIHSLRHVSGYLLYLDILLCHYFILKVHFYFPHRFCFKTIHFCGCIFLQVPPFWNV